MLDKFRETAITWDKANRKVYEPLRVSAGDNKGRKLTVQLVNDGVVEDLTGASLSLFWETRDKTNKGLDAFTSVDATKGEFEIYYTTGMLSNEGTLNANLVLVDTSGRVVSEPFKITVFKGIDDEAIQSSDSFTALTEALIDIGDLEQNYAPRLSTLEQNDVSLSQQLQQTSLKKVGDGVLATLSDMGQDVKEAMTGGSVAVVGKDTVIEENVVDRQITPRKMTIFTPSDDNLINPQNFIDGYINNIGEVVLGGASRVNKDIRPLKPNTTYRLESRVPISGSTIYLAFYKADGTISRQRYGPISSVSSSTIHTFTTISNEVGYRISCLAGQEHDLYMHEGAESRPYAEPLIISDRFLKTNEPYEEVTNEAQSDFVALLQKHNQSNKTLKAKMMGDRRFVVYQPIANGKHVAHTFTKDNNDDFIVYDSAIIGNIVGDTFNTEQYMIAGSNKEVAILAKPKGSTQAVQWFPEHNLTGTAFAIKQSILFDGVEKVAEISPGEMIDVSTVNLTQEMNLIFPGATSPIGKLILETSVTANGVTYNGHIEWLTNVSIDRGYVAMLPTIVPPVDTLRTSLGNDYSATLSIGETNLLEKDGATSFAFVNKNGTTPNTSYVLAQTINNPSKTLRKGKPGRKEPNTMWLEHRSASIQKLYPQIYNLHEAISGEVLEFSATIYVGIMNQAGKLLF